MPPRSTAGCYTCKRRKKKCDETQPQCLRCVKSGKECEGYAPLESPDGRGIMRRAKVAPGRAAPSQLRSSDTPDSPEKKPSKSPPASSNLSDQQDSSGPLTQPRDSGPPPSQPSGTGKPVSLSSSEAVWYPEAVLATSFSLAEEKYAGLPTPPFASFRPNVKSGPVRFYPPSTGNYSSDAHHKDVKPFQTFESPSLYYQLSGPSFPHGSISEAEEEDGLEDHLQVKQEMCIVPAMDPNTADNTLPFVLECYARWINLVVFEPTKAVLPMKESIIDQFMRFPDKRATIILLANTIGSLGKSIHLSPKMSSLVTLLRTYAYQTIYEFTSRPPANHRETDRQNALHTLDLMMEVVLIQRYSYSMSTIVRLMEAAAPVFRRACPEPLDQYVNLPRAVLSPSINIRHFATTDIIMSITTGRPLLFRYDVTYPPDILEQFQDGRYGMQWLHGIADQYIVLLARINVLFEEFGPGISPRYIAEIEDQIHEVATFTERSSDPVVTIWKFAVRECWKLTMFIYLYMVLCRASTADPRVLNSVKSYVRLMETVKPGRNPDSFLYIPLIIVGASAYRRQDRAVIHRRMLGLQEFVFPGSCGYDAMNMLIDLWTRTEAKDRPAVWDDLRESAYRVTHI
ncbi:putative fungal Zn(2)-cys(6) binuclear cluster domain protein [Rhizoctonia solani 123E]|uniref:Putative fungal Zn(2)-cys(6) binuclear cluster domain protein n=1 Tax=Rhizoctonia solani 123E TaxID=1423351 RepID=A0A074RVV5_9AGAM|nr:putative fungal Zn(2)-cys(6) binuclear cluster domain protein [Rhizoctonia solani 123E]